MSKATVKKNVSRRKEIPPVPTLQRIDSMFKSVKKIVTCPKCESQTLFSKLNEHLDSDCKEFKEILQNSQETETSLVDKKNRPSTSKSHFTIIKTENSSGKVYEEITISDSDDDFEPDDKYLEKKRKLITHRVQNKVKDQKLSEDSVVRSSKKKKNGANVDEETLSQKKKNTKKTTKLPVSKNIFKETHNSKLRNGKQNITNTTSQTSKVNDEHNDFAMNDSDDEIILSASQEYAKKIRSENGNPCTSKMTEVVCDSDHEILKFSYHISQSPNRYQIPVELSDKITKSPSRSPRKPISKFSPIRYLNRRSKSLPPQDRSPHLSPTKAVSLSQTTPVKRNLFSSPTKSNTEENNVYKPYYLTNFNFIMKEVLKDNFNTYLLNENDSKWIQTFQSLPETGQKLYVRLFQRKYKWLRKQKIKYDNIAFDLIPVLKHLEDCGLLITGAENIDDLPTALKLLSLQEIQQLRKDLRFPVSGGKGDITNTILSHAKSQRSLIPGQKDASGAILKKACKLLDDCYKLALEPRKVMVRIMTLFCLPHQQEDEREGHQQLLMLLMINIGKMKFPQCCVLREKRIYQSRDDLIRYENVVELEIQLFDCVEKKDWIAAVEVYKIAKDQYKEYTTDSALRKHDSSLPVFLRQFTAGWALVRILNQGAEALERLKKYPSAVSQWKNLLKQNLYLPHYRGRWYDRLTLDLDQHLKKSEEAFYIIKEGLLDSLLQDTHRLVLSQRAARICNRKRSQSMKDFMDELKLFSVDDPVKVVIKGQKLSQFSKGPSKSVFMHKSVQGEGTVTTLSSVEEFCLTHYKKNGYTEGIHAEGIFPTSLFGMFFWDILYNTIVPDVFLSSYQGSPLDLNHPEFYNNRKVDIEARLNEIRQWNIEDAHLALEILWAEHIGEMSAVSWDMFKSVDYTKDLVSCVGLPILACICEKLSKNYRHFRSGFPDLAVWNPDTKIFRIVEVKGPGDHLSPKQVIWLDFLRSIGAPAEVCHVEGKRKFSCKLYNYQCLE